MPNVTNDTELPTYFPNKYAYPYGNDPLLPMYSSIPIPNIVCEFPAKIPGDLSTRQAILNKPTIQK